MLTQIDISNLITIQKLHLDFKPGTTVMTGETGAGKSILIDAIELALGARANADIVRKGQEKADISLCFDISRLENAKVWLKNYDLEQNTNECIIRRTIHQDGRSRCFINGMPTTLQPLRELALLLLHIHGQHEHQALLKGEMQRDLLDRYAGHQQWVDGVFTLAEEYLNIQNEIKKLQKIAQDQATRSDFLRFQLQELLDLHIIQDEFQNLDLEHKQLSHAGELLKNINQALQILSDNEEANATSLLNQTLFALEPIQGIDPKVKLWLDSIKNALIHVSDAEDELRRYLEAVDLDPERLQKVDQRIRLLFDMSRKHKVAPHELFDLQNKIASELNALEMNDSRLLELSKRLEIIEKKYLEMATKLSQSREAAAKKLAEEITKTIRALALPHAEFFVAFEKNAETRISIHGAEKIIFQIKTNAGHALQPLAKVASGGELSRISLAIHMATANQHTTSTLIFDEVDVGIGGGTAEIVGKLLRELGETHQVLCITHQPQVAALGHHHLLVKKNQKENTTSTEIHYANNTDKINELARMLGGIEITKKTLAHAREMVESAMST